MKSPPTDVLADDLDHYVDAFESARSTRRDVDVENYLPEQSHPRYSEIVVELLRIDLEWSWKRGTPKPLAEYGARFCGVLADRGQMEALAFEEYRLRRQAGEAATAQEYRQRFGVEAANWPRLEPENGSDKNAPIPNAGEQFLNFKLDEELGRGSFGRVFLARQIALADRPVALKISPGRSVEPERLAQLQHANIVPIYSVHESQGLQAVCMPFLGRATLADALGELRQREELPRSGAELISTVVALDSTKIGDGSSRLVADEAGAAEPARPAATAMTPSIRKRFEHSSYVDAVAWIGAQLAAGLVHAHERGILHRDLKPANILLADDGRPMILDFNLSDRPASGGLRAAAIGGTLPYMAPEHLEALETGHGVDARSDIYSLGVVLFELLTRRLPFAASSSTSRDATAKLAAERRRGAPPVRRLNSSTPPSVSAIVARCLAPNPADRYQAADELRTDLERHLEHRPLLFAPDRSPKERLTKWTRRHPRLSSGTMIGATALVVLAAVAVGWQRRGEWIATLDAQNAARSFIVRAPELRVPLSLPGVDPEMINEGLDAAQMQVATFGAGQPGPFKATARYSKLPAEDRSALDAELAKTLYLMASASAKQSRIAAKVVDRRARLHDAAGYNQKAAALVAGIGSPLERTILDQQAAITRELSSPARAQETAQQSGQATTSTSGDRELRALELIGAGRYAEALPLLVAWRDEAPTDVSAWMTLGHAHLRMGNLADAEECFTTCTKICPRAPMGYFQRGVARLERRDYAGAVEDFSTVLDLPGCHAPALINRALARRALGDYPAALADLDAALADGAIQTRVYFIRSDIRKSMGQNEEAEADRLRGLSTTPVDAASWLARGVARLSSDPEAALADFREAESLAPGSRAATQNIVHVLADRLGRDAEARQELDVILTLAPDDAAALASRAVVRARLGDAPGAMADTVAAIRLDHSPTILFQSACAFALVSVHQPDARAKAIALLGRALGAEPTLAARALTDQDLAALRDEDKFRRVIDAAKELSPSSNAQPAQAASPSP